MGDELKPQDVVVALKLVSARAREWKYAELADELFMSASEVHGAVKRLEKGRLFNPVRRTVDRLALRNFLVHGLAHVFPTVPAEETRGMPTASSAPPLAGRLVTGAGDQLVWEAADGQARGRRVEPLYRSVPKAAAADRELHQLLALADALRVGRARERQMAADELKGRLQ